MRLVLFVCIASPAYGQDWQQITPNGASPQARSHAAAIYDPEAHRIVLFGGRGEHGFLNDVWALDLGGLEWTKLTAQGAAAPPPRFTPAGAYDPERRQMLIWSGQGDGFFNDVWAFDLLEASWSRLLPSTDAEPNDRYGVAAVYDPVAGHLVTFAGFTDQGRFDDTWRFDVENTAWTEIGLGSGHPGKRCLHTAVYDAVRHRMIMFGGQRSGPLDDLWALDMSTDTWTELVPPPPRPSGRYFAATVYDAENDRMLMFGGNQGSQFLTDELWSFSLANAAWQLLSPTGSAPSPREGAAAVYVPDKNRMIVLGGRNSSYLDDVWSFDLRSTNTVGVQEEVPTAAIQLHPNHPNPFAAATSIVYEVPRAMSIEVMIYDMLGREVQVVAQGAHAAGRHVVTWNTRRVVPGTYVCRLRGGGVAKQRLLVVTDRP
jgi:hypothetical protein